MNQSQAFAYFLIPEKCDRPVKATNSIWVRQQTKMSEIAPQNEGDMQMESYIPAKTQHGHHHQCFNSACMWQVSRLRSYRLGTRVALSSLVPRFSFGNEASLVLGTYKIYREYRVDLTLASRGELWGYVKSSLGHVRLVSELPSKNRSIFEGLAPRLTCTPTSRARRIFVWDRHQSACEHETFFQCVELLQNAWDLTGSGVM